MKTHIEENSRNPYLDYIRGISAMLVVLYHYTSRYVSLYPASSTQWGFFVPWGRYAVLTFFLLSGYLSAANIEKIKARIFGMKRFWRICPTFWIALLITAPCTFFFLPERAVSVKDFLLNFTMIPALFGAEYVDGAYWTLFCEIFFYFLIVIICFLKLQKHVDKLLFVWSAIQLLTFFVQEHPLILLLQKINSITYLHCFLVGVSVSRIEKRISFYRQKRILMP